MNPTSRTIVAGTGQLLMAVALTAGVAFGASPIASAEPKKPDEPALEVQAYEECVKDYGGGASAIGMCCGYHGGHVIYKDGIPINCGAPKPLQVPNSQPQVITPDPPAEQGPGASKPGSAPLPQAPNDGVNKPNTTTKPTTPVPVAPNAGRG